jgi:hopanoid biosynthesis associated RND transporter like protein HpnN
VLKDIVVQLVKACTRYAKTALVAALLLAALSGVYTARNFALNTDIGRLIAPSLDWRQREIAYDKAFPGGFENIVAVVDSPTPELTRLATEALEQRLAANKTNFKSVQNLVGNDFFKHNGLLFLPTDQVKSITEQMAKGEQLIGAVATDPSLRGLTDALALVLAGAKRGELAYDDLVKPLNKFSDAIAQVQTTGDATFSWRELISGKPLTAADKRGYLMILPVLDYEALEPGQTATDAIRQAAADLKLGETYHARVRLTGPVAVANEEFGTVRHGAIENSIVTIVIVMVILWLALHSPRIIMAVAITLGLCMAITTAVGLMLVGSFNPISIAFAVLCVGLGVDFGIQYSVRYRAERYETDDLDRALIGAAEKSAVPLSLAAVATTAGFLSFLPTNYLGVSELGAIAGAGMIIAFIGSVTVLPALLKLFNPPGEKAELGYGFMAPVDDFLERHRIAIIVITLGVAVAGLPLLYFMKFDFNPMNLRNPQVESIATYLELRNDPNSDANAIQVLASNYDDAKAVVERLEKVPTATNIRWVNSFIPPDQPAKLAAIKQSADVLKPTFEEAKLAPPTDEENVEALNATVDLLKKSAEGRTGPGHDSLVRMADLLGKLARGDEKVRGKVQDVLTTPLKVQLEQTENSLRAGAVTLKSIPPDIMSNWINPDGIYRIEASPKGDPNDNETLRKFATDVLAAEPRAISGPISILKAGETVSHAFIESGLWALASIAILLWIVLRRIGDVLLTLVPLVLAGVVTLEICVLIGLPLNFANIVALPLLLGVGVAFKIYYVTAWRGGQTNLLQSSLTRAIFFSALTTATAFGSLWLSDHPGTSSMGKLLALSLVTTLAAAVLFQPALMGKPRETHDH